MQTGQTGPAHPSNSLYHRWLGWYARASTRVAVTALAGLISMPVLWLFVPWQLAVLGGWDVTALLFLAAVWPTFIRADGPHTEYIAVREDDSRDTARLLVLAASTATLVAVAFALGLARHEQGGERAALIGVAALTLVLSWMMVNTVFILRYAHLYYNLPPGSIDFGATPADEQPDYRDFAYLALTIGMTYQVSDTVLRSRTLRRAVLPHAALSYVFGVVIVASGVNTVAGLL
jgi:uncharacterized membrane protein